MNRLFKPICILALFALVASACDSQTVQGEADMNGMVGAYQVLLGKSLNHKDVNNFLADNNCFAADSFQLCRDAGMALWVDTNQIVNRIYLYSGNDNGFRRYLGELPFGITFYDPMWFVMNKLRNFDDENGLTISAMAGLPDTGSSPDHVHYWAEYKRFNMIVIYDSPFADEDAYIFAIVVTMNDSSL